MFALQDLQHRYQGGQAIRFPDWSLAQGEQAVLIGPSGSGKTTLLALLGGMLRPSSGQLQVADQAITSMSAAALDRFRGSRIGVVPQKLHLIASLSVLDNLRLAPYLAHLKQEPARIAEVLERLGLSELAQRRPHQLSQGQAQRVAIARALLNRPSLLLADEPTANLDDDSTTAVIELLTREASACGASLLIASHDSRVKSRFSQQFQLQKAGAQA